MNAVLMAEASVLDLQSAKTNSLTKDAKVSMARVESYRQGGASPWTTSSALMTGCRACGA